VRRALGLSLFLCIGAAGPGRAQQLASPGTGGVAALTSVLRQLGANKRVLLIGAHPDDENNQLLTLISRGYGVQAAYLSLSRGEGGQDLIGPELGPELGIIRSEELLAARQLDGAGQFFSRAYDFGYSKSAEEAFRFWPRDSVLKDVLDVIRRFRPQIIVSIFSGTPRDGHGQHQVAGQVARQAFDLLQDSAWGPAKLYRSAGFDTAGATLVLQTGTLDPVAGQSYAQIASASRSLHRSQDQGGLQRPGPGATRLALVATRRGQPAGDPSLFAGVDTVLHGQARFVALIDSARARLNPWFPAAILPYLTRAARALTAGPGEDEQRALLERAIAQAAGVVVDGVADDAIVIPGQRLQVDATVWNAGADSTVRLEDLQITGPVEWVVSAPADVGAGAVAPGTVLTRRFTVTVPDDAERSQPYFLRRPLAGALYDWTGVAPDIRGEPFAPPLLYLHARVTVAGVSLTIAREIVYRFRDQGIGEIRRPIFVTQPFDLTVTPNLVVWPIGGMAGGPRRFTVTVTNRSRGPAVAQVLLTVPRGWSAVAAESLAFAREDETKSITVTVALPRGAPPPPPAGSVELRAAVVGQGGRRSEGALAIIDYPHIRPEPVAHPSAAEIRVASIALPTLRRVGYVRGAADRVPEALEAVGVPIEMLDADTLARGDLSRYDAIVIGSRAYETDPALVANNGRLLDYARGGGLVLVQYQQYAFIQGGFAPFRMSIAQPHDRVTDETALATPLDSASPVFRAPNLITADDWQGWVQERGLYFAHDWDPAYAPLLEMHDPGGTPLTGGLLVARLGQGTYVYTGLSFFRQLPAGVPGAYRLFANLLGLRRVHVP
jgi:LmbE family N-acetylglucosaminyl deacetylase